MNANSYRGHHRLPQQRNNRIRTFAVGILAVALTFLGSTAIPAPSLAADYTTPLNAMFYYPWFPQTWHTNDHNVPALGQYSSDNPTIVAAHVAAMRYAGMDATIASWWGQGQQSEQTRFPQLYAAGVAQHLGVIPYYEPEGVGDPSVPQIQADLAYLGAYADTNPGAAVRIGGKRVIFVYNAGSTGCGEVTKWKTAAPDWYVNMKVFSGFATCPDQPSGWHQYGPASAEAIHLPYSFNISPGFWHHNEATPRLVRDPARWASNVAHLKASGAQWQLVTSFNEWGEDTSVEPSPTWQTPTGWGYYLDELHRQLVEGAPAPSPSPSPSPTLSSSPTPSPSPSLSPSPSPTTSPSPTPSPTPSPSPTFTGPPGLTITIMAAGDIVAQGSGGYGSSSNADGWTAELLTRYNPLAILGLGDQQYEQGSLAQYQAGWGRTACFSPTHCDAWGRHIGQVYPAPGNHEWSTGNAQGYRDYFAARLAAIGSDTPTPAGATFYSFDLGSWHFISLDSDVSLSSTGPQLNWLRTDLAANNNRPTLAYWHHPTWSSGDHGSTGGQGALSAILVGDRDVQIVLNGHDHDYERFAPMGVSGPDSGGIRYFVVGTGGKSHYCAYSPEVGTQVFNCNTYGTLALSLGTSGYSWRFHPISEVGGPGTFTDAGTSQLR